MNTARSAQGTQSSNRRAATARSASTASVSSDYSLPVMETVAPSHITSVSGAMATLGTSPNSSASPTPTSARWEQSFSPSTRRSTQGSISKDEGSESYFDTSARGRSLPRIISVEGLEERLFRGNLSPIDSEAGSRQNGDDARTNNRLSNRATAPLLQKDASISSMSSNISSGTTASSMYTPRTPLDDPRTQHYTEPPRTTLTNLRRYGDPDQPPRPIHPPLSTYSPSLYPTFSSSQAMTGFIPPMPNGAKITPPERRLLRNLSLAESGPIRLGTQPDPKGQAHDREAVQQPNPCFPPSTPRMLPEKSLPLSYEQMDESDPLSVLAYAGRMLDEEAHKPP